MSGKLGVAGDIARAFVNSKLTPLILFTSIALGLGAVWLIPREEEPQIKVPMIDVLVSMPGRGCRSIRQTLRPVAASSAAQASPTTPAPTTTTTTSAKHHLPVARV